jgi:WhiB family transcriptional regulator, redox-sensing transcriptional regulator
MTPLRLIPASGPADWRDRALCRRSGLSPDAWFPRRGPDDPGREAKAVCAVCPVAAECLDYALTHSIREGIFGGLGEGDRRRLRRGQGVAA